MGGVAATVQTKHQRGTHVGPTGRSFLVLLQQPCRIRIAISQQQFGDHQVPHALVVVRIELQQFLIVVDRFVPLSGFR